MARPTEDALTELAEVATSLAFHVESAEALYERRARLFLELREAKVTYAAIAAAAGTTEGAVLMACRKQHNRAAG